MREVFADTFFWIAVFLPNDAWAATARAIDLSNLRLVTTEEVLSEFLTAVSGYGPKTRELASQLVREVLADPEITMVEQSHRSFTGGLALYQDRLDKDYSLVDCVSMNAIRKRKIREVLTRDRHFVQEGFVLLFPS